jgi:lipid A ethanolaminephosphotransferase
VAAFVWLGKGFDDINRTRLRQQAGSAHSHDEIFSTILGLYDVNTTLYDPKRDLLKTTR